MIICSEHPHSYKCGRSFSLAYDYHVFSDLENLFVYFPPWSKHFTPTTGSKSITEIVVQ